MRFQYVVLALAVAGCSDNPSASCPPAQTLSVVGYSAGTAANTYGLVFSPSPFPASTTTFIYFNAGNQTPIHGSNESTTETGIPIFTASDGSTVTGGILQVISEAEDDTVVLDGYSSSVSGLKPGLTYGASFKSLRGLPDGCEYGAQAAGSFSTD